MIFLFSFFLMTQEFLRSDILFNLVNYLMLYLRFHLYTDYRWEVCEVMGREEEEI